MKLSLLEKTTYFIKSHHRTIHFSLHILIWIFTCLLALYTVPLAFKDNRLINNYFTILIIVQTLGFFYAMGYWIFPNYLYHFRPLSLLVYSLSIFYIIYLSNYYSFSLLLPYSDGASNSKEFFIEYWWQKMHASGLLGPFKNVELALQNFVFSLNVSFSYLVPKLIKDFIVIRDRTARLEITNLQLHKSYLELELDFLRSQMNPHFLFNTLNSIYARIFTLDETAAELVLRLSELMRYSLYEASVPAIHLENELQYIQNYLVLEKSRLNGYPINIQFQQTGQSENWLIAPLILIVFVENAFKHGVTSIISPGFVLVDVHITDHNLTFIVSNSITVSRPSKLNQHRTGGIGIKNVNRRLESIYKNNYQLTIINEPSRYVVTLSIQLKRA